MKKFRVGLDNYCLFPKNMMPDELLTWASVNGAEGVAFSGFETSIMEKFSISYLHDVKQQADALGLYIEWGGGQHAPIDLANFTKKEIFDSNRKIVEKACALDTRIVRSCSGGLMRWKRESPDTEFILEKTATELKKQASLFRDNNVILSIETHFEFTTFELLRLFEMCGAEPDDWLGICLDTMNLLTMLEDPLSATDRVLPWIVSTHIKDGGILVKDEGIITFPVPFGKGIINFEEIFTRLNSLDKEINLSVETHGGSFFLPVNDAWFLNRFPDLAPDEYNDLVTLAEITTKKMKEGDLKMTEREDWPMIYEERTHYDIRNLKITRDGLNLT
jgi:sugar phosphate isomerase/epimerase